MPFYDYKCESCGLEWEQMVPIKDRNNPPNPPDCDTYINGHGHCKPKQVIGVPALAPGFGLTKMRPDEGFKDILRTQKKFYDKADALKEAKGIPHQKNTLGNML
jgi:putative FmdB family regulatory protein